MIAGAIGAWTTVPAADAATVTVVVPSGVRLASANGPASVYSFTCTGWLPSNAVASCTPKSTRVTCSAPVTPWSASRNTR